MRQKAPDEAVHRERAAFGASGRSFDIAKGHLAVGEALDPIVRECNPEDVASQILQRGLPTAHWPTIYHPRLRPGFGADRAIQRTLAQGGSELGAKQLRQRTDMHQEGLPTDDPGLSIRCKGDGRNQVMQVWVIVQIAGPGLQDPKHADLPTKEAWILSKLLQSRGGGSEEQRVDHALVAGRNGAEASGEREGDQKVGD
jgi:hypothetical protein